ncbi:MAG: hypothetical protein R2698_14665 [Microthrixaceae bacterium]
MRIVTGMSRVVRRAATAVVAIMAIAGCVPPSINPDGTVAQDPPIASNGLIADGSTLWVADFIGRQLLKVDPDSGRVLRRVGPAEGMLGVDDGVLTGDGSIVATAPNDYEVIRIAPDGTVSTLAHLGFKPNPIVADPIDPDRAVIVGGESSASTEVVRVFLDGRGPQVLASGLPALNAFDVGSDGRIWAPTGGLASIFGGTGGVARIDLETGVATPLPLSFPGEPDRSGFTFPSAAKFGPDGFLYVVQGLDGAVYRIDPTTGGASRLVDIPGGTGDNLTFLADGRMFVSNFLGTVAEVLPGTPATTRVVLG